MKISFYMPLSCEIVNPVIQKRSVSQRSLRPRRIIILTALLPILLLHQGCANTPKATSFSVGGALTGAAIGASQAGIRGAIVGAAIGGFVGNRLGAYLDDEDMKKLAELEQKAASSGRSTSFVANKTGNTVTITPEKESTQKIRSYSVSESVVQRNLKLIEPLSVAAYVDTPLYHDTSDKAAPKGVIKKGQPIFVPAHVGDNVRWGAVVDSDNVIGYVPLRYLDQKLARKEGQLKEKQEQARLAKTKIPSSLVKRETVANDANGSTEVKPITTSALNMPLSLSTRKVDVLGSCKRTTAHLGKDGEGKTVEKVTLWCLDPPPKMKKIEV